MYSNSFCKNRLIFFPFFFLAFLFAIGDCLGQNFITKWNLATAGSGPTLLIFGTATSGTVSYSWQEVSPGTASGSGTFSGSSLSITGLPAGKTIRLQIVPINFQRIIINYGADRDRLIDVEQWGTTVWTSMAYAFNGCINMQVTATDSPNLSGCTDLSYMFFQCYSLNSPANIGSWNVSAVTNMSHMFSYASAFNQNLGTWNVSTVTNMSYMFSGATAFNQNIDSWNVSAATNMSAMFIGATAFNQNMGSWNVSSATDMSLMFYHATAFNQNIGAWNVSAATNMSFMFYHAIAFNQNIGAWNVSAVTNMSNMFNGATAFNQNIDSWDVSAATNMSAMFAGATAFNQNLGIWNVGTVTNMSYMFIGATAFNQNISLWNVSATTNMSAMFNRATAFNQNIDFWNVDSVTNMSAMFYLATAFNQSIAPWATKLNVGVNLANYLDNSGLSTANYDATLIAFDASAPNGRAMGAAGLKYCAGTAARAHLIGTKGWNINGDMSVGALATWYLDADGDGYAKLSKDTCASPGIGYTTTILPLGDCNDSNPAIHPCGLDYNCNGIDENCNGIIDEGDCFKVVSKAILGGAYFSAGDTMSTSLQIQNMIPLSCPYDTAMKLITIPVNMVDWVKVELVDTLTADTIYASQCACLLRDGSIQSIAGDSTLLIAGPLRPYISLRIKHRNHLSTRSSGLIYTPGMSISFDFRNGTNLYVDPTIIGSTYHNVGLPELLSGSRYVLWPGDGNGDGQVKYQGSANDRGLILSAVGGTVITNTVSGYLPTDITLNGQVKYQGSGNDRAVVLSSIGGTVITKVSKAHD